MGPPAIESIAARAMRAGRRVVLPESSDPRVLEAAREIARRGYARVTLLGSPAAVQAAGPLPPGIEVIDPGDDPRREEYIQRLVHRRRKQGLTAGQADALLREPVYFGAQMVADDRADGMVAGSLCATADTVRAALWAVGIAPGYRTVSSCSIMQTIVPDVGAAGALIFADTGVVPEPTVDQLAEIAVQAGEACRLFLEVEPRVAMISFSTKGSAVGPPVQAVIEALEKARRMRPDLMIDGELQVDAALVPDVAARKVGDSEVAGRANVLVFPSLSVGNVAYKLVERLGNAVALGPVLLGLDRPVNDLSRGCSVEDIVLLTAVTAVQAAGAAGGVSDS